MSRDTVKPTSAVARRALTTRRVANPGVSRLRKDADNKILQHSEKIADALVKGAKAGNASSARLLVDLADSANWTQHADSVAQVLSIAVDQWKKEDPEQRGEVPLQITPNPPKLQPPPRPQLTDGQPQPEDGEVVEGEVIA